MASTNTDKFAAYVPYILGAGITLYLVSRVADAVGDIFSGGGTTGPGEAPPDPANVTLSQSELLYMAREIYVAVWGEGGWAFTEDEERVIDMVATCRTNDDLLALSQVYGCRAPKISVGCWTLTETIRSFFTQSQLRELNGRLQEQGITLYF